MIKRYSNVSAKILDTQTVPRDYRDHEKWNGGFFKEDIIEPHDRGYPLFFVEKEQIDNFNPQLTLSGKTLYIGVFWEHFGHFMLESTNYLSKNINYNDFDKFYYQKCF